MNLNPKDIAVKIAWLAALGVVVLVGSRIISGVAAKADHA